MNFLRVLCDRIVSHNFLETICLGAKTKSTGDKKLTYRKAPDKSLKLKTVEYEFCQSCKVRKLSLTRFIWSIFHFCIEVSKVLTLRKRQYLNVIIELLKTFYDIT